MPTGAAAALLLAGVSWPSSSGRSVRYRGAYKKIAMIPRESDRRTREPGQRLEVRGEGVRLRRRSHVGVVGRARSLRRRGQAPRDGHIVGICGNWGAVTRFVGGWHNLFSFIGPVGRIPSQAPLSMKL